MARPARVVAVDPDRPDFLALGDAAATLRSGGLVAFPTETVYGLGADATNSYAVARIFEAKGRPATNPLIVHAEDVAAARRCAAAWPQAASDLAARFWPGPLTIVLPRSAEIVDAVAAGGPTVGIRVPAASVARELIRRLGRPVAAPSANRSTGISPTTAAHVAADLGPKVDLILDAGPAVVGIESTVLDLSGDRPAILRPGSIAAAEIAAILGEFPGETDAPSPASPGQMAVHYAPRTPTYRVDRDGLGRVDPSARFAVIALGPAWPGLPPFAIHLDTPAEAARHLYADMHACDDQGLDFLVIVPPPDGPEWRAIRDRVGRASTPYPG